MLLSNLDTFIQFFLCTAPCQFTISKTNQCLQHISQITSTENNHISIILTNCSLEETKQWKSRLNAKFKGKNVVILSSKSDDHRNIASLNLEIMKNIADKNYEKLPDVIVMCTHSKRTDDCFDLIRFCEFYNKDKKLTFSLFFDEIDVPSNLTIAIKFLKKIEELEIIKQKILKKVVFITATPLEKFWSKIKKELGLKQLENFKNLLTEEIDMKKAMENYRKVNQHNIKFIDDNNNPVCIVKDIISKFDDNSPRIIYAPAKNERKSHEEMIKMAHSKGYDTLIINGIDKKFNINKNDISIKDFNEKYEVKGELRDTLVKYREKYPENSLLITGNKCIERGITFNTTGFNFTDMILSLVTKDTASLIQMIGRANGNREYVKKMNIWIPEYIWNEISKTINIINELQNNDKTVLRNEDFDYDKNTSINDNKSKKNETVPYVFNLTEEEEYKFNNEKSSTKKNTKKNKKKTINYKNIRNYVREKGLEHNIDDFIIARHKTQHKEFKKLLEHFNQKLKVVSQFSEHKNYKEKNTCHVLLKDNKMAIHFVYSENIKQD